jgi:hypothetical protein
MRAPAAVGAALLGLLACAGLPRLTLDGDAPWRLADGDPLLAVNERLNTLTGGDDIVAVVVRDLSLRPDGLLYNEGVEAIEAVRIAVSGTPGLARVNAITTAPLLDQSGGTLSAATPLRPPPTTEAGWAAARAQIAADPFAKQLVGEWPGVTSVVGWVVRGGLDTALVGRATSALQSGELAPEEALALRRLMSEARLAVALGDAEGPPDAAAARALRGSPLVGAKGWVQEAEVRALNPASAALADVEAALAGLELPTSVSVQAVGPAATEAALESETPVAIRHGLLAVLAAAGLAGWTRRRRRSDGLVAVVGGALAFGGTFGLCGWLGVGLHPWIAVLALLTAAWTSSLIVAGRSGALRGAPAVAAPAGLALAFGGGPGVGLAAACALGLGLTLAGGLSRDTAQGDAPPRPKVPLAVFGVLAAVALWSLVGRPLGADPARMLDGRHPVGAATQALSQATGTAPSAFLVFDEAAPGSVAAPAVLRDIAHSQQLLVADDAVAGSASWADLIAGLHGAMTGGPKGQLPDDAALVEQYLLLFGRPQDTRSLAAPDGSLATALVRLAPGGGRHLARLSGGFPAGGDGGVLAGQGVSMARAARSRARASLWGFGLGALLLALGLGVGRPGAGRPLLVAAACAVVAAAIAAAVFGSIGLPVVLAAAIGLSGSAVTLSGDGGRVAAVPLLALGVLALSPVTLLSGMSLGACAGVALALAASSRRIPG